MNGCPFCGVMKRGHSLRCHVQACSKRDRETGGKDALDMLGSGRAGGRRNRRFPVARVAVRQPVRPVHAAVTPCFAVEIADGCKTKHHLCMKPDGHDGKHECCTCGSLFANKVLSE